MYKTLLVFDSYELMSAVKRLHIWGMCSEFEIEDIVDNGAAAYRKMKEKHYDLVVTEIRITGLDGLQLLRAAKNEGLCSNIVLCSEFPDFNYARQGIILGACDYYVLPFEESLFFSMFSRIKNKNREEEAAGLYRTDEIAEFFEKQDKGIYKYVSDMLESVYSEDSDILRCDKKAKKICMAIANEIFSRYEWLDLYITSKELYSLDNISESSREAYKKKYNSFICGLFDEFCRLFPHTNSPKIRNIILYILNNPEDDIRLKSLADRFYTNSSYLSTVFGVQTGMRFVDYLTGVRLKRAAWLLKETNIRVTEIAERLDYKDIGYFSRLFKKEYGLTPSEYRQPEGYNYQI